MHPPGWNGGSSPCRRLRLTRHPVVGAAGFWLRHTGRGSCRLGSLKERSLGWWSVVALLVLPACLVAGQVVIQFLLDLGGSGLVLASIAWFLWLLLCAVAVAALVVWWMKLLAALARGVCLFGTPPRRTWRR